MKKFLSILSAVFAGATCFMIGTGVSEEIIHALKNTGCLVTASDIIRCQLFPWILAIAGTSITYHLCKD